MIDHTGVIEHERRFLVADPSILEGASFQTIDQGYLWVKGGYAVRVRLTTSENTAEVCDDSPGVLALKGPRKNAQRFESEMIIPRSHANTLLDLCNHRIVNAVMLLSSSETCGSSTTSWARTPVCSSQSLKARKSG